MTEQKEKYKKIYAVIAALIVMLFGYLCVAAMIHHIFYGGMDLSFIENTTGIDLPNGIMDVDTCDNWEMRVEAHVRLPKDKIGQFISTHGFSKPIVIPPYEGDLISSVEENAVSLKQAKKEMAFTLKPENRYAPVDADFVCLMGRTNTNTWTYQLDRNTGRLWIEVLYPDSGGDAP